MKAARIHEFGDVSVIRYEEVPMPVPGPGEVLVKVAAASFNPSDIGFRSGLLQAFLPVELPAVLGAELSGVVVEADGTSFTVGEEVIGRLDRAGACAEYVAVPAVLLTRAPRTIPLTHAAAVPVAALTAWQAVFEHAKAGPGQRVLVNGAGGGVGTFAVQLAKRAGAYVIATASARSAQAVLAHGADEVVGYPITTPTEPVDAVLSLVPGALAGLASLVRPGGIIVSVTGPVDVPAGSEVRSTHFVARNDVGQLAEIVALIDAGGLTVDVTEIHALSALAEVHRRSEAGLTRGKIVLVP
jgi:NADPH:quinone reductase-like Zn-dependent oxidoreductase